MENRKHILFISSWYPNRNNPSHGIFNRYFAEAASLHQKVSVLHICSDEHMNSDTELTESTEQGIYTVILYYKKINHPLPLLSQFLKRRKLFELFDAGYKKIIREAGQPDLIHLNVVWPMGLGAYHLSQTYNIPYVVNECWTGYSPEDGNYKGLLLKYFTKKIISGAKVILPVTSYLKKLMLSHGLTGQYAVVPNVVDVNRFTPLHHKPGISTRFLHISTLDDRQKNVSGIIRSFARAYKTTTEIELILVGEGSDKSNLQELANTLEIGHRVHFKGRLMDQALVNEINESDCLLMFSNYETFCLVIPEGFACGKPVITSDAGGIATYMKPELGVMIAKKDEAGLTRAILHFLTQKNTYDSQEIRQFVINNFSTQVVSEKLNAVYQQAFS